MKNKILALAVVGVMLSVCFAGVFSYTDDADADAITGTGKPDDPYNIGSVQLSKLKDQAIVYFNLSYDKQYLRPEGPVCDIDGEVNSALKAEKPIKDTDDRFKGELKALTFTNSDVSADVTYKVTLTYAYEDASNKAEYIVSDYVYYKVSVTILGSNANPDSIKMKFEGNVIYDGNWAKGDGNVYTSGSESSEPLFKNKSTSDSDSFYSSDLPKGLYLKTVNGGATITGMIGSAEYSEDNVERTFHVYQITDKDVIVTEVKYTVDNAKSGLGFTYLVSDKEDKVVLNESNDDKIIIVKSGTELKITTTEKLTQFKTVDQTNKAYDDSITPTESDSGYTYTISNNVSGTVKVFMTYNNGINDNCTKILTIIYIGSTADASLSNPVVRSY